MNWWLVITVGIAAALVYAFWDHLSQGRRLTSIFARLRASYGGNVDGTRFLTLPQFRFELSERKYLVTAMASSGTVAQGSSGYSGPFTLVDVELPFEIHGKVEIVRSQGVGARIVDRLLPGQQVSTGDQEFDAAFRIRSGDAAFAVEVLDKFVRRRLMESKLPRVDVRLRAKTISVHMDGFAQTKAEVEELIHLASLFADRCQSLSGS